MKVNIILFIFLILHSFIYNFKLKSKQLSQNNLNILRPVPTDTAVDKREHTENERIERLRNLNNKKVSLTISPSRYQKIQIAIEQSVSLSTCSFSGAPVSNSLCQVAKAFIYPYKLLNLNIFTPTSLDNREVSSPFQCIKIEGAQNFVYLAVKDSSRCIESNTPNCKLVTEFINLNTKDQEGCPPPTRIGVSMYYSRFYIFSPSGFNRRFLISVMGYPLWYLGLDEISTQVNTYQDLTQAQVRAYYYGHIPITEYGKNQWFFWKISECEYDGPQGECYVSLGATSQSIQDYVEYNRNNNKSTSIVILVIAKQSDGSYIKSFLSPSINVKGGSLAKLSPYIPPGQSSQNPQTTQTNYGLEDTIKISNSNILTVSSYSYSLSGEHSFTLKWKNGDNFVYTFGVSETDKTKNYNSNTKITMERGKFGNSEDSFVQILFPYLCYLRSDTKDGSKNYLRFDNTFLSYVHSGYDLTQKDNTFAQFNILVENINKLSFS